MSTKPLLRLLAGLLALVLVAAACGGDDEGVSAADCDVGETDGNLAIYN